MKIILLLLPAILLMVGSAFSQNGIEIESERTAYSKTFLKENGGREQVVSAGPIHYKKDGAWLPIELELLSSTDGFINETNSLKSKFPESIAFGEQVQLEVDNSLVSFEAVKRVVLYDELNGIQELGIPSSVSKGTVKGSEITYEDVYQGITDRYTLSNGIVKNEFQLNALPGGLMGINSGYFGFQERIILPAGWSIEPLEIPSNELITSALKILNANNERVLIIPAPIFFESGDMSDDGASSVEGGFIIDLDNQGWLLSTVVPVNWLKDSNRSFPVILDPTVVLAGADGGWQSQNNFVNNPGFVFIGVCCGNFEHRAWLKFSTLSIPDASCVTNVELEVFVNGVGGAAAELVHAYDMTGAFGPYGGIMPAVYADMATGWYTSFELLGAGTYGYFDLGANADALLQAQLPGDWYQVSLIFDNEPSTNWKRLTAGQCNLRVTYDDPPCVVLPIGLQDFETTCDEGHAKLTWKTITESNNDYFTLWRSENGVDYEEVGKVEAIGNSSIEQNYHWTDGRQSNELVYYKLSQTDNDGTREFFDPKAYLGCANENPVVYLDDAKNIHITGRQISFVDIRNNLGSSMVAVKNTGDMNEWILSNPSFAAGLYTAIVHYDNGKQKTITFLITE